MKLYIVRHGETDANARGIVQGWLDTELNGKGLAQAARAAKDFDKPIDAIYASDLSGQQELLRNSVSGIALFPISKMSGYENEILATLPELVVMSMIGSNFGPSKTESRFQTRKF